MKNIHYFNFQKFIGLASLIVLLVGICSCTSHTESAENGIPKNRMIKFTAGENDVTFKSQGVNLAGHLYLPEDFDASNTYPTIVFSGPFNQVKEQMGAKYGQKFAAKGYAFLAFERSLVNKYPFG